MLIRSFSRGVTLIELMIAIAVLAILLLAGVPTFGLWLQNLQIRTAAESIQSGLQSTLIEAVRRNTPVRFNLTDVNGRIAWTFGCVNVTANCPAVIQSRSANEGGVNARAGISTDEIPHPVPANHFSTAIAAGTGLPDGVTFDGLGQVAGAGDDITRIDITNIANRDTRRLVIAIGPMGQIRMCDPAIPFATNPQGCR